MAESEEELKSLLMKVKEVSEKVGLKFNIGTPSQRSTVRDVNTTMKAKIDFLGILKDL